jgi:hypothetical protein
MSSVVIAGDTSGTITLAAPAVSGTTTLTLPATTGTVALTASPTFTGQATIPTINLTGGQIAFPATAVPSSNANTLDDYEEGTWTPALTCTTPGTFSYTNTSAEGTYTKIGNIVTFSLLLGWSAMSVGTGTGDLTISGIPFTSTNSACAFPVQTYFVNWVASSTSIVGQPNSSGFIIRCIVNDGDWGTILITSQSASQQNYIRMSGSYYTT